MKYAANRLFFHSTRTYHTGSNNKPSIDLNQAINTLIARAGENINTVPSRESLRTHSPRAICLLCKFVDSEQWSLIHARQLVTLDALEQCSEEDVNQYEDYLKRVKSLNPMQIGEYTRISKEMQANSSSSTRQPELASHYSASCK